MSNGYGQGHKGLEMKGYRVVVLAVCALFLVGCDNGAKLRELQQKLDRSRREADDLRERLAETRSRADSLASDLATARNETAVLVQKLDEANTKLERAAQAKTDQPAPAPQKPPSPTKPPTVAAPAPAAPTPTPAAAPAAPAQPPAPAVPEDPRVADFIHPPVDLDVDLFPLYVSDVRSKRVPIGVKRERRQREASSKVTQTGSKKSTKTKVGPAGDGWFTETITIYKEQVEFSVQNLTRTPKKITVKLEPGKTSATLTVEAGETLKHVLDGSSEGQLSVQHEKEVRTYPISR